MARELEQEMYAKGEGRSWNRQRAQQSPISKSKTKDQVEGRPENIIS